MSDYNSGYDPKYGYNRNAFAHKTLGTAVMGRVIKIIVTPLGLVSEAIHARNDKRRPSSDAAAQEAGLNLEHSAYVEVPPEMADELIASGQAEPTEGQAPTHELVLDEKRDDGIDCDEADWALDEAAADGEDKEPASSSEKDDENPEERLANKVQPSAASSAASKTSMQKLPFPVIVPQRRPRTKARGFVRAYPPVFEETGISQDAFLSFLKKLHKAAQASPIFDVVVIATAIAGAYPDPIVGLAVQAVQVAAGIGQEMQESEQLEVAIERVDLGATAIAKYGGDVQPDTMVAGPGNSEKPTLLDDVKKKVKQLRIASAETHGEAEMPVTCAPLIFPALDAATVASPAAREERNSEGIGTGIKAKSKNVSKFVNNYYDRRAQASYAYQNPESTLTAQVAPAAPNFRSRFADPNNATNTHFFTLITGGKFKAEPLGARRRYERAQRKAAGKRAQGIREQSSKRLLQKNVLDLMVVSMPTEEELVKAKRAVEEAKKKKAASKRLQS
ncbi:MAG: hypothetical protein ASARMPREDX12_005695 [Alectoria sarmentosa]|nr:MAG: hypothetical protein ASARMPREDX12_005695 [Alectoria sarmentosa]